MSSTPAPPASPVLSVDGTTPRAVPLAYESDRSKVVTSYADPVDQPSLALSADLQKVGFFVSQLKVN